MSTEHYDNSVAGFYELDRGLIAVWGGEAVRFLDGLISNNVKKLEDGAQMLAAFPNVQSRLLAMAGIRRQGDKYLIETEAATREKVFQYLHRFTFAGDFFVEDLSAGYEFFEIFGPAPDAELSFSMRGATGVFVASDVGDFFRGKLVDRGVVQISDETYEVLRVECGIPKFGVDIDENTIVPEIGIDEMISYNKGCYIGQEIIARIHFRGHVAKKLTGLVFGEGKDNQTPAKDLPGIELTNADGNNAGKITSAVFSAKLGQNIALAYVRYDFLGEGTQLFAGKTPVTVKPLPFVTAMPAAS